MSAYVSAGDVLLADWSDNQKIIFEERLGHVQPTRDTPWNPQWDLYPGLELQEQAPRRESGHCPNGRQSGSNFSYDSSRDSGQGHTGRDSYYGEAAGFGERCPDMDTPSRFASWDYRHPSHQHDKHILDRSTAHPRGSCADDDYTAGKIRSRKDKGMGRQSVRAKAQETTLALKQAIASTPAGFPHHRYEIQQDLVMCIWCGARSPPAQPECPGNPDFYARR